MSRLAPLVGACCVAAFGLSIAPDAGGAETGASAGRKVPMHPSTLTLKTGAHAKQRRGHYNYAHDPFHQPTPIHGTMAGPPM